MKILHFLFAAGLGVLALADPAQSMSLTQPIPPKSQLENLECEVADLTEEKLQCENNTGEGCCGTCKLIGCFEKKAMVEKFDKDQKKQLQENLAQLAVAFQNETTRNTDFGEFSIQLLFEGLSYCGMIQTEVCADNKPCQTVPVATKIDEAKICGLRTMGLNALSAVSFDQIEYSRISEDESVFKAADLETRRLAFGSKYGECVSLLTSAALSSACDEGRNPFITQADLKTLAAHEADRAITALFDDISSPFYAMFFQRKKIADSFLTDVPAEKSSIITRLTTLNTSYEELKTAYLAVRAKVQSVYDTYKELVKEILDTVRVFELIESKLIDQPTLTRMTDLDGATRVHQNTIGDAQNQAAAADFVTQRKDLLDKALENCRFYYCVLNGQLELPVDIQFAFTRNYCNDARRNPASAAYDPLCLGKYKQGTTEKSLLTFCTDAGNRSSRPDFYKKFWGPGVDWSKFSESDKQKRVEECVINQ